MEKVRSQNDSFSSKTTWTVCKTGPTLGFQKHINNIKDNQKRANHVDRWPHESQVQRTVYHSWNTKGLSMVEILKQLHIYINI